MPGYISVLPCQRTTYLQNGGLQVYQDTQTKQTNKKRTQTEKQKGSSFAAIKQKLKSVNYLIEARREEKFYKFSRLFYFPKAGLKPFVFFSMPSFEK